jgi:hypothetical protein
MSEGAMRHRAQEIVSPLGEADSLRTPMTICSADPRMDRGAESNAEALEQRHAAIEHLRLPDAVPEPVRIHFETAKNVWLYSWFVYRFHMVAVQYVLTTLEFAARTRFESLGLISSDAAAKPGLGFLLKEAQKRGLITNVRFGPSKRRAYMRAKERKAMEVMRSMLAQGVQEQAWEFTESDVRDEDWEDWLSNLIKSIPEHRNDHAHGTPMLYSTVLGTFDIVHDLICQLWNLSPSHTEAK